MIPTQIFNAIGTQLLKCLKVSDLCRWRKSSSLSSDWDSRTKLISTLIPSNVSVLEFGAGRMILRGFLPSGCLYTPSDIVSRGSSTLVCDLNANELPVFPLHDIAVLSGVMEYVNDIPRLAVHLSRYVNVVICSYAATDRFPNRFSRRSNGWVNDYSIEDIIHIFESVGFGCVKILSWESQAIFKFVLNVSIPSNVFKKEGR